MKQIPALSILQPWAWLIVHGWKDVENRTWSTRFRGRFLVHAGMRWGGEQREDLAYVRARFPDIPLPDEFERGGIVGAATLVDCVAGMDSQWFSGPQGFVVSEQSVAPRLIPCKGALGFFKVPDEVVAALGDWANRPPQETGR